MKVVKDITAPKSTNQWTLNEEGKEVENEEEIAEIFNDFFVTKIKDLKENIVIALFPFSLIQVLIYLREINVYITLHYITFDFRCQIKVRYSGHGLNNELLIWYSSHRLHNLWPD